MTKTSDFGTGKREGHDSTVFYDRNLYKAVLDNRVYSDEIAPLGPWADQVYCQSSENMYQIPTNSIALAFTSPPYNVGKRYDADLELDEYFDLIEKVGREVYRVLIPGGRYVFNIANLGRKPYIPMNAYMWMLHQKIGFLGMGEIIWQKGKSMGGSCAWGSWVSAKAPRLRDVHEYLLVLAKGDFSRPDKGESTISRDDFLQNTISIWQVQPESAKRVGHPAPFPVELARRVIELYSYKGDVVLDPFLGSGTTAVAANQLERHYVGFDIFKKYVALSRRRIVRGK